ncbi:FxSxx-COOH protein [Streptomyces laculatispora]|uniref:FxSxx-COOH protein n=1 Tax=Streptomyces laculatispora TaxID=887464 RepID=A0ABY9I1I9_9ACTN|nr:FxSxx-COOH cyclophane-containing RiPP peptide [Streptomyces laculatispora]WLQ40701.1 FxSxx-COOH protein [Streptomyces laculatispora]
MSESTRNDGAAVPGGTDGGASGAAGALPDLLGLDLETLRTLHHPVLAEVVADLRGRAEQPREMLWGFNNAF